MKKKINLMLLSLTLAAGVYAQGTVPEAQPTDNQVQMLTFGEQLLEVNYQHDVVYATKDGVDLHLQILTPMTGKKQSFPCLVYVVGSAWQKQNMYNHIPCLSQFAQRGYVIALVEYRHTAIAPFPAQLQDAKTAIRFLRKNADKYSIDASNMFVWGDSSGGHTALFVGVTQGTGQLDDPMYGEVSADVNAVIAYYPPTEIYVMRESPSAFPHEAPDSPEGMLIGGKTVSQNKEAAEKASPLYYVTKERKLVPILIAAGTCDAVVPFSQSDLMANKLKACGQTYEFYALEKANHGTWEFWTPKMYDIVEAFIKKNLHR